MGTLKQIRTSGMTAAAVLIVAIVGGAAGGAMVLGGGDAPASQGPVDMGLKVADSDALTAPATGPSDLPALLVLDPVAEARGEPVAAPQGPDGDQVADDTSQGAEKAAQRSERAADRSEDAADRSEDAAERVATAPAPSAPVPVAPKPTPLPQPASTCTEGEVQFMGRADETVCRNGQRVSAAPNRHCKFGGQTPSYVESGTTTRKDMGGVMMTYRCEDGKLTGVRDDAE